MRRKHKCLRASPCSTGWFPGVRCLLRKEPCNSWREAGFSIRIWISPGDPPGFPSPGPAVRRGGRECSQVVGVCSLSVLVKKYRRGKYTSPRTIVDAINRIKWRSWKRENHTGSSVITNETFLRYGPCAREIHSFWQSKMDLN